MNESYSSWEGSSAEERSALRRERASNASSSAAWAFRTNSRSSRTAKDAAPTTASPSASHSAPRSMGRGGQRCEFSTPTTSLSPLLWPLQPGLSRNQLT